MTIREEIEHYVGIFGEEYRRLITDSLLWLAEQEPKWGIKPIGRKSFLRELIAKARRGQKAAARAENPV